MEAFFLLGHTSFKKGVQLKKIGINKIIFSLLSSVKKRYYEDFDPCWKQVLVWEMVKWWVRTPLTHPPPSGSATGTALWMRPYPWRRAWSLCQRTRPGIVRRWLITSKTNTLPPQENATTTKMRHPPNAGSMLGQRRRRWTSIETTLGQWFMFAWGLLADC